MLAVRPSAAAAKLAQLTWDDGKLVIASADGTSDELQLRQTKAAAPAPPPPKRYAGEQKSPSWPALGRQRSKPKTLFDLIFGN